MSTEMFTGDVKSREFQMWLSGLAAKKAATKKHHLGKDMVNGTRPLTQAAYDGIMRNLARCEDITPAASVKEETVTQPAAQAPEQRPRLTFQDVPAGFYATPSAAEDQDYDFWKVRVSEKSQYRSVARVLGGGTTLLPKLVEVTKGQQMAALRAIIREGVQESSDLYAEKESRCVDCGRQLTDEESRANKRGAICQGKNG